MNLKLDELRRRLLEPVATTPNQPTSVYKRSSAELVAVPQRVAQPAESSDSSQAAAAPGKPVYQTVVAPKINDTKVFAHSGSSSIRDAALRYAERASIDDSEGDDSMESNSKYQVAQAVAKVFEQVKVFEDRFAELTRSFEPVEAMAQTAARSFSPLRAFHEQLAQLSRSFEPMRTFQDQLAEMAQSFAPMKGLQHQLGLITEAFEINIDQLVRSLAPVKEFQAQLVKLAQAFDSATELADDFAAIADAFRGERRAHVNGAAAPAPEAPAAAAEA